MRLSNPVLWEKTCGDQLLADVSPECDICQRILNTPEFVFDDDDPLETVFTESLFEWVEWNKLIPCLEHVVEEHRSLLHHFRVTNMRTPDAHPLVIFYEELDRSYYESDVQTVEDERGWETVKSWIWEQSRQRGTDMTLVW